MKFTHGDEQCYRSWMGVNFDPFFLQEHWNAESEVAFRHCWMLTVYGIKFSNVQAHVESQLKSPVWRNEILPILAKKYTGGTDAEMTRRAIGSVACVSCGFRRRWLKQLCPFGYVCWICDAHFIGIKAYGKNGPGASPKPYMQEDMYKTNGERVPPIRWVKEYHKSSSKSDAGTSAALLNLRATGVATMANVASSSRSRRARLHDGSESAGDATLDAEASARISHDMNVKERTIWEDQ